MTIKLPWKTPDLSTFEHLLPRERLIQAGRIVIIDDEYPLLIDELINAGFAIDHDKTGNDLTKFDNQIYDVAIIDFHGVGQRLGSAQGLDLLKHIRRVSPRTRIIAYTSRSLTAFESDFFTLSNAVLPKDLGLVDSLTLIEGELQKAFSKEHLFQALLEKLQIKTADEKKQLRVALAKSLTKGNDQKLKATIISLSSAAALKVTEIIVTRLLGL